jgi:hypothetical protein
MLVDLEFTAAEIEFKAEVFYTKAQQGRMYMANGDPGYPDEPETMEIENLWVGDTDVSFLLRSKWKEELEDSAWQAFYEDHEYV